MTRKNTISPVEMTVGSRLRLPPRWCRKVLWATLVALIGGASAPVKAGSIHPLQQPIPWTSIGAELELQGSFDATPLKTAGGAVRLTAPMQDLAAEVRPDGLWVQSMDGSRGDGPFRITAVGAGRAGGMPTKLADCGEVRTGPAGVSFVRPLVVEEYSSSADGLRQDFVLPARPPGSGVLHLHLSLMGAMVDAADYGMRLILPETGREIAYSRLLVMDADDRHYPASMQATPGNGILIVVEDVGARYPLRVDPTFSDADWVSLSETGADQPVNALAFDTEGNLYAGGLFSRVGEAAVSNVAKWNGNKWSALGVGLDGSVTALAVSGTNLFAAGNFTTAGGIPANRVARWDGTAWSPLGSGMDAEVKTLLNFGNILYAGGRFNTAGGVSAKSIAKWDGTAWSALGAGFIGSGTVQALVMNGSELYAGGNFNSADPMISLNNVARWNGVAWTGLGAGVNGAVNAMVVSGGQLYAGGFFSTAGSVPAGGVAIWNGTTWSSPMAGTSGLVSCLSVIGGNVYAGGNFVSAGGVAVNGIARWDGSVWSALGTGMGHPSDPWVFALAAYGEDLYVGGQFTTSGGAATYHLAKWSAGAWAPLGRNIGLGGTSFPLVRALTVSGGDWYAGGDFTRAGGGEAKYIAKWNGNQWSSLGSGMDARVRAVAADGGLVYAAGDFTMAGGVTARGVAKWDGTAWTPLGSGSLSSVNALAVGHGKVYAAGAFGVIGGTLASRIAQWNGSVWSPLGAGLDFEVSCLAISGGNLYAGGGFFNSGTLQVKYIAKWDGTQWSAMGGGMSGPVRALAVDGGDLYAGGSFNRAGTLTVSNIAKWNGSAWSALGGGVDRAVHALTWSGGMLFAGGEFLKAGGNDAAQIAKWEGGAWSALGSGTAPSPSSSGRNVLCLAGDGTRLFAGGEFSRAGGKASPYIAQLNLVNGPEITLSGNGVEIASGSTVPDPANHTSFGNVPVGSGGLVRTFLIRNAGGASLSLNGAASSYVMLSGSGAAAFSVTAQPLSGSVAAGGGTQAFTISFHPGAAGVFRATVLIANNDPDEGSYTFGIGGTGIVPMEQFSNAMAAAGLTGDAALPSGTPKGDGVPNLLKYAFNMNAAAADSSIMASGTGTAGLPVIAVQGPPAAPVLRVEFLRRLGSGLTYTPKRSPGLNAGSWLPLTDTPTVTPIDASWERVVYEEPVTGGKWFARVEVALP